MPRRAHSLFYFDKKISSEISPAKPPCVVGIDEVGRGPLAGPVVACAIVLPEDFFDARINDSKKLTPQTRFRLFQKLKNKARWALGQADHQLIDSINILKASHHAIRSALQNLLAMHPSLVPDLVLIDGLQVPKIDWPQKAVIGGDAKSAAIAAASIMAKVSRDRMMKEYHKIYPHYGFARHKGYGTALHQKRLRQHGPSPIHRRSFAPVASLIQGTPY